MLLALLLVSASTAYVVDTSSYSFYTFTLEWKPTMCLTTTCVSGYLSEAFNIHGLWPSTSASQGPSDCSGAPFSVSSATQTLLETCWLSDSSSPQAFWLHEWTKHGTCVVPATTPDAFFTKVVGLYNTLDLQGVLAAGGVKPNNDEEVELNAIYSAFSTKVNVACYCQSSTCYLENVEVCYNLNYELIDCAEANSGCSSNGKLIFPASD